MQVPAANDLRWREDVQGVIEASVANVEHAFQTVAAGVHESQLKVPANVWLDGPDLPPSNAWPEAMHNSPQRQLDVRILINGYQAFRGIKDYMVPLVLLAWMNSRNRTKYADDIVRASCKTSEVLAWIDAFLGQKNALGARHKVQQRVNKILNDAARHICERGGLAAVEDTKSGASEFTLWFREPPGFLPTYRQ